MRRTTLLAVAACLAAGCGAPAAKVTGRVLENGTPRTVPPSTASVMFVPAGTDPTRGVSYTTPLMPDGSFDVLVSGGTLPPGTYDITVDLRSAARKGAPATYQFRREIKTGPNDLTLDLAKPGD